MGHHKHHYSMKNFLYDAGKVTKPINKDVNHLVDSQPFKPASQIILLKLLVQHYLV